MTAIKDSRIADAVTPLARGLAARLRDAAIAADRLADFSFDERRDEPAAPSLPDGDEWATADDFVLRVLAAAGDPLNARLLDAAARAPGGIGLPELAAEVGLSRLALIERVHGLIQLGLVARDLQADTVCATAAGTALTELVGGLQDEVARWLDKRRR